MEPAANSAPGYLQNDLRSGTAGNAPVTCHDQIISVAGDGNVRDHQLGTKAPEMPVGCPKVLAKPE